MDERFVGFDFTVPMVTTFKGARINLRDPNPEDIDPEDIAHHLANTPRFGGATESFYSVAQHCVLGARRVSQPRKRQFLMHDSPEYVLGDIPKPLKYSEEMIRFRVLEEVVWRAVTKRFGIEHDIHDEVKYMDSVLLVTEARDCLRQMPPWVYEYKEHGILPMSDFVIEPWEPRDAKFEWMKMYRELFE